MRIRDALPDDAGAVAAIWNHYIRGTHVTFNSTEKSPDGVSDLIGTRQSAGRAFLVVEEGGRVAGFATYDQFRAGVGYSRTMEHTVLLAPEAAGRGLGRALIEALEAHARAAGHGVSVACVSEANPAAIAFHERLGYRAATLLPQVGWKYGRWWDLRIMTKRL